MKRLGVLLFLFFCCCRSRLSAPERITEKVAGMEKFPGFFTFYWDAKAGKIWLEIDKWNTEFLYVESLPAGIGSNDIGLDRGQLGSSTIVRFDRIGPRVLLIAPNYDFRATTNNRGRTSGSQRRVRGIDSLGLRSRRRRRQSRSRRCHELLSARCPSSHQHSATRSTGKLSTRCRRAVRSIFQTRKTFRKTPKSKRR